MKNDTMIVTGSTGPHRLYKDWPSKNKFCCGGRLIHGPDRYYFWAASAALIGGGGSFLIFVTPEIYKGDVITSSWNVVLIPVFAIIWIYTMVMHNIVAYMDPGIIPRSLPPPKPETDDLYIIGASAPAASKNISVNDTVLTVKYCNTCNLYRPPRAIHCGICDNCVSRFDHHCPYVGNCVGQRNYRFFLHFIFGVLLTSLLAVGHCVTLISVRCKRQGISDAYHEGEVGFIFAWLVGFLSMVSLGLVGVLVGFTSFLVSVGRTTNENIKHAFPKDNPFHLGCPQNWFVMCCPPNYPPLVNPRAIKVEEV